MYFSGSTSIAYSTSNYCSSVVPSWVSIDSSTGVLTIAAPSVDADTEFDFYVSSSISGLSSSVMKLIKLTIANCQVQNWQKCSSSSYSTWTSWNLDYVLKSGAWVKNVASTEAQVLTKTVTSMVGASMWVVSALSLLNTSLIVNLRSIINQIQLLFLLLLTRAFIPFDIQSVITGIFFVLNFPSLIQIKSFGLYNSSIGYFNFI